MKRNEEVHILEYGALLSVFLAAVYLSSLAPTGFFIADEYAYSKEVNYTSVEKKASENVKFGNYSIESCVGGVYVETKNGMQVNFTLKNEKHKKGMCTKATVVFDNIIYSKADKKKNATSITYVIYYGKVSSGAPSDDTDNEDEADEGEPENSPPQFLKDIGNVFIEYNGSYSLDLPGYFSDNGTLSFAADGNANISISFQNYTAAFTPLSYPYNGTHRINATDGEYVTPGNVFIIYANPPPLMNQSETAQNETNITQAPDEPISVEISMAYPKNNSVLLEGSHAFVFSSSNGTCFAMVRNQTITGENYLEKGYYWWGVSCEHMNRTFRSGKNYFVVMPATTMSMNYSAVQDLANAANVTIERSSVGKLVFDEPIDLTAVQEMERYINISRNRVEIDTVSMQHLNKSAVLTLYGVTAASPIIKQDGRDCPLDICQIISYEGGTLVFRVKHFTVYEVEDTPASAPESSQPQPSGGGGSGNYVSGGSGGSGGYYDGPVIITKKNQTQQNTTNKTLPESKTPENNMEETTIESPAAPQAKDEEIETPYTPPAEKSNENIITGGIINIFAENFMYIALLLVVAGAGYLFTRNGNKKRKRK